MFQRGLPHEPSPIRAWVRTHLFRTSTALVTLMLFGLCFLYKPELLTWWLRTTMSAIERTSAMLPYPWGDRVEFALRGFGGSFWMQITLAIILVRVVAWGIAASWRRRRRRRRNPVYHFEPVTPPGPATRAEPGSDIRANRRSVIRRSMCAALRLRRTRPAAHRTSRACGQRTVC